LTSSIPVKKKRKPGTPEYQVMRLKHTSGSL
jgi:hypothetical protein